MSPQTLAKNAVEAMKTPIFNLAVYLVVLSMIISAVAVLGFAAIRSESRAYSEQQAVSTSNTAKLIAQSVEGLFKRIDITLRSGASLIERSGLGSGSARTVNQFLAEHRKLHPEIINLRVTDEKGDVRFGVEADESNGMNLADRPFFIAAKTQKQPDLIVSGPIFARIAKRWVLVLARRIEDGDQRFLGVIYANIDVERFSDILTGADLGGGGASTLRNEEGYLIYRNPKPHNEVGTRNISPTLAKILEASLPSGTFGSVTQVDGVFRENFYQRVNGFPLYVIVGSSQQAPITLERARLIFIFVLILLTVTMIVLGGVFYLRKISQYKVNIDDRIELEKSLLKTQQALQRAEEIAQVGNWVWDIKTDRIECSAEIYSIFNVPKTKQQLEGEAFRDRFSEENWTRIVRLAMRCADHGIPYSLDAQVVNNGEANQWVSIQGAPYYIADGQILKIHGTVQDITSRKNLEVGLKSANDELADLYDQAPCGYFSLDADGRYTRINKKMRDWIGLPDDQILGKMSPRDSLVGVERTNFQQNFSNLKVKGSISNEPRQFLTGNGETKIMMR